MNGANVSHDQDENRRHVDALEKILRNLDVQKKRNLVGVL